MTRSITSAHTGADAAERVRIGCICIDANLIYRHVSREAMDIDPDLGGVIGISVEEVLRERKHDEHSIRRIIDIYRTTLETGRPHRQPCLSPPTDYRQRRYDWKIDRVSGGESGPCSLIKVLIQYQETEVIRNNVDYDRSRLHVHSLSRDLQESIRAASWYLEALRDRFHSGSPEDGRFFLDFSIIGTRQMQCKVAELVRISRLDEQNMPSETDDQCDQTKEMARL